MLLLILQPQSMLNTLVTISVTLVAISVTLVAISVIPVSGSATPLLLLLVLLTSLTSC